jgi:hypothetical protein
MSQRITKGMNSMDRSDFFDDEMAPSQISDSEISKEEIVDQVVLNFEKEDLITGIIYSEILSKPLSKRKTRRII